MYVVHVNATVFSTDKARLKRVLLSANEEVTVLKSFDSFKMSLVQCFENS